MNRRWLFSLGIVAAILVQCGIVLSIVQGRASILRHGREVTLLTAPVDPRDLLRGDYVRLNYAVETIEDAAVIAASDQGIAINTAEPVYLIVKPGAPAWPVRVTRTANVSGDEVALKAKVRFMGLGSGNGARIVLELPISRFYVPEGEGLEIEKTEKSRVSVVAAVDKNGNAAIKKLLIDGKPLYQEPPY